ncbi:MAG: BlaI/MecI/CopY family transcriptional regulator [Bacteroidales bacterium]|nr:BlaI/MecI/CopY family transcriptional regulator [Bacteroidales bacterium]MCR5191701.1 BlaI/MecI/CopY family transcriptional regulator [Bacteroidales bacterium]
MKNDTLKELTKAEEQVMQAIWKVKQGFANEIVAAIECDTAYNTVLTVVRTLEQKGFVGHETFNRSNRYYPLISKEEYMQRMLGGIASRWFGSSPKAIVSFLVDRKEVSLEDLEAITNELES